MRLSGVLTASLVLSVLAAPAMAQSCPTLKQVGNIKLSRAGAGGQGVFLMPMLVNGTPRQMVMNLGSAITDMTPEAAADLKLPTREIDQASAIVRQALGFSGIVGAGGKRSEQYTHIDSLVVGNAVNAANIDVMLLPKGEQRPNPNVIGNVGVGLLSHFDLELDLANSTLNLFDPKHCDQVAYWNPAVLAAVPIHFDTKGRIRVKVFIDGTEMDAVVSTGAIPNVVSLDAAESFLKFDKTAPGVVKGPPGAGGAEQYRTGFTTVALEGITIQNPKFLVLQDKIKQQMDQRARTGTNIRSGDNQEPDVTLGLDLLAKLHIFIDFGAKKMYVSAAGQ